MKFGEHKNEQHKRTHEREETDCCKNRFFFLMHDNTGKLNLLKIEKLVRILVDIKNSGKTLYWYLPVQLPSEEMPSVCMTVPMIYP